MGIQEGKLPDRSSVPQSSRGLPPAADLAERGPARE